MSFFTTYPVNAILRLSIVGKVHRKVQIWAKVTVHPDISTVFLRYAHIFKPFATVS